MEGTRGIVQGHAYSLLGIKYFKRGEVSNQEERLVKLRNPWGNTEWMGRFSDDWFRRQDAEPATSMNKPALITALEWTDDSADYGAAGDGAFWMSWDDFVAPDRFNSVAVCHIFNPGEWHKVTLRSAWTGRNGQGCKPDSGYGKSTMQHAQYWAEHNALLMQSPQFTVETSHAGSLYIEMQLEEGPSAFDNYPSIAMFVYDWTDWMKQNNRKERSSECCRSQWPEGPWIASAHPQSSMGFMQKRSMQLELCGRSNPRENANPRAGYEYTIGVHRLFGLNQNESVGFTITAWFRPDEMVSVHNTTLRLNYAEDFSYLGAGGTRAGVTFEDIRDYLGD